MDIRYKEKSVIIHRDENGFGLRVGGQNPVFVDFVHENGAAWKAGVRKDDMIIKVNGTLVRSYDHQRVVHMIQNCTPFVNLTLHSPETIPVDSVHLQSNEPNNSGFLLGNNNSTNNNSLKVLPLHQRMNHPSPNNLTWLLNIGDDLFQDNSNPPQPVGVSKLISGPSPSSISQVSTSGGNANTRDNPYYYYKTAPEKSMDATSCNTSLQDQTTSKSIVRSRSAGKMSTRSTTSKYRARNLKSRLVEDLRSLTIANSQTTPSSLSTSPSSSDLSDCDSEDSSRIDCSNSSVSGTISSANSVTTTQIHAAKPQLTTRRLEIIRELVDTEKTHVERLKHLNDLLYKPIKNENLVPLEQLKMIFSCHKALFKIHKQVYKTLLAAQQNVSEDSPEPLIGKALIEIFEGELGARLEKAASVFCACQSTNGELLNRIARKDTKSGEFLAQVANQQMIGRLGIKDLLASCFQRLTKYPLLLENLLKATNPNHNGIHSKSFSEGSIALPQQTTDEKVTEDQRASEQESNVQQRSDHSSTTNRAPTSTTATATTITTIDETTATTTEPRVVATTATSATSTNDETEQDKTQPLPASLAIPTTVASGAIRETIEHIDDKVAIERLCISRALNQSRQILIHVNEAVNRAIAQNKLRDIWKKTDRNPSLPVIDIATQQMLHEGPLTLRLARRTFEVYVLLLTHYLVILTREGAEKYKLKYFTSDGGKTSANQLSPIFNIDEHLVIRDTATDENGFYLLCKRKDDSRIYEFASQSPTERAKWKEKIHMAQLYNFAVVPEDDNTLTRYRELISLVGQ